MDDLLGIAVRGLHYAALVLLFGGFIFALFVLRPALREAGAAAEERGAFAAPLQIAKAASLFLVFFTGFLWLWLNASTMSGAPLSKALSPALLGTVLGETEFGRLWQFRAAISALLALLLLIRQFLPRSLFGAAGALLSGVLLASLAVTGHALHDRGMARLWHQSADILHLLAAGAWLGALPPFAFVLQRASASGSPVNFEFARAATLRFSTLGLCAVATLIATGFVNAWYLVGSVPALLYSLYGQVLLLKLALFAGMVALASTNRLTLTPKLSIGSDGTGRTGDAVSRLARNAAIEAVLGLAVLFVVGWLGHLPPAIHWTPAGHPPGMHPGMH